MRICRNLITATLLATVAIQLSAQDTRESDPASSAPSTVPTADVQTTPTDLLDQLLDSKSGPVETSPRRTPQAAGEDIQPGTTTDQDPVVRVGQRMMRVEQLLQRRETSQPTQQLQEEIVRDLDALIAAAEKPPGQPSEREGREARSEASLDGSPAVTRPSGSAAAAASRAAAQPDADDAWMLRIWGHLPDRLRQQIHTPVHEEFLPAYERVIQEYYRRLAEVDD